MQCFCIKLQDKYFPPYLIVIFLDFKALRKRSEHHTLNLFVLFLTVVKSPPWGQALIMAVVYVCLVPASLH